MNERYSRQLLFPPIGREGQARIHRASVLLVGCGALGTHLAELLVRAGVGELRIVDRDIVEASNLQRQGLFTEADASNFAPKASAAERALRAINSEVRVVTHVSDVDHESIEDFAEGTSLIVDATDNFETRLLINDYSVRYGTPWVYAACVASRAMSMPVLPGQSACLACLMDDIPALSESCDTAGIIMPAVLSAVAMAGAEALKLLAGRRDDLVLALRSHDLWTGEYQSLTSVHKLPGCRACDRREFPWLDGRAASQAIKLCGRNAVQLRPDQARAPDLSRLASTWRESGRGVQMNELMLRTCEGELSLTLFPDGRALITGTTDFGRAKSLYARLVGS